MNRLRRIAWLLILIADAGLLAGAQWRRWRRNICPDQAPHQS
jgi:hypothetical protein